MANMSLQETKAKKDVGTETKTLGEADSEVIAI